MKPWTEVDKKTGRFVRQQDLVSVRCVCKIVFQTTQGRLDQGRGKFCSKKCMYRFRSAQLGEKHYKWSGPKPKYSAVHKWVAKEFGRPMACQWCNFESSNTYQIQWANISGEYTRKRLDWIRLCAKCHYNFDRKNGIDRQKLIELNQGHLSAN